MKSRVLALIVIAAAIAAVGIQQTQIAALREEVGRLRSAVEKQRRPADAPAAIVPIQGAAPSRTQPARPTFRLLNNASAVDPAIEKGMKADEFDMQRRQEQWLQRQNDPFGSDPRPVVAPPWLEGSTAQPR